jgi:hypothetical protein
MLSTHQPLTLARACCVDASVLGLLFGRWTHGIAVASLFFIAVHFKLSGYF